MPAQPPPQPPPPPPLTADEVPKFGGAFRLAAALPGFFRDPVDHGRVRDDVRRLVDGRGERFLELARTQIYARADSPYLRLLEHAGCALADLQRHVRQDGLEPTLSKLAGEGVYLTSDEFKGRVDVVRGGTSLRVSPMSVERRGSPAGHRIESSGSRGAPVMSFVPLDWRGLQAMGEAFFFTAHDLYSYSNAVYEPVLTGRISTLLINSKLGVPTERWFALKVPAHGPAEEWYHRLNARAVAVLGRRYGAGIANPEYVDRGDSSPVTQWVEQSRRAGRRCCIRTVLSNAVAIARFALETGVSLEGTIFSASGEPLTAFKKQLVEQAGGRLAMRYGPGGGICAALGCGTPEGTPERIDEVHVPLTAWTCVTHPLSFDSGGHAVHPLLLTTVHEWAPRLLFNVGNGDHATMTTRNCGCPLEGAGFTTHLHTVRSFEKLTSEGMNYFGADLATLLEVTLPAEFGGGVGDYQLVEEEDPDGQTRVTLVVHPSVGPLDHDRLLARLRVGLSQGSRNYQFMASVWATAGTFRVRREAPRQSRRGKVLPLHVSR